MTNDTALTGGCQCGAIRYEVSGPADGANVCHCRMCQRAVGQPYMAAFFVKTDALSWTQGAPKTYRSSNLAERGFCSDCGSPLYFRYVDGDTIAPMIASLDAPNAVAPTSQFCIESRLDWVDAVPSLPDLRLADDPPPVPVASRQFEPGA